ncbi:hypothetical protein Cgig2_017695 [Carnegiea gigantea]|uniref:Uncharacterized protein n=1 Tax=Carnegiea gigantea TaxID=171969 RepID=A0A9Q1GQP1_9CARY|nr:hypothetical protein Cgig2_017695 [Carnegiea gigantea]
MYNEAIEPLKENVRALLIDDSLNLCMKTSLIDAVGTLGISYFYEHEVKVILDQMFEQLHGNGFEIDSNFKTAAQFQIFKQHGYNIPCVRRATMANGVYFERQYSIGRILLVKVVVVITVLDDTYNACGTLEELQPLTNAFETAIDQLPDNIKIVYEFVINHVYENSAKEMTKRGKPYIAEYSKGQMIDSIGYYMEEVKSEVEYMSTYEEYTVEGRLIGNKPILLISSLMGMDEIAHIKPSQLIRQAPKSIRACELICRLVNDLHNSRASGDAPSVVERYMKKYSVSRQKAIERFEKMMEDAWKDINEATLTIYNTKTHDGGDHKEEEVSKPVLEQVLNLCQWANVLYKYSDGFTHPAKVGQGSRHCTLCSPLFHLNFDSRCFLACMYL